MIDYNGKLPTTKERIAALEEQVRRLLHEREVHNSYQRYAPPLVTACSIHGTLRWIESTPRGHGYCQQCAIDERAAAPACPKCGTKRGFAFGTGDCGCDDDY